METIRQIVEVKRDPSELGKANRKLELTLPETVEPGLMEVTVLIQPVQENLGASQIRDRALDALEQLRLLTQDLPAVDTVSLIREGRDMLDQRGNI